MSLINIALTSTVLGAALIAIAITIAIKAANETFKSIEMYEIDEEKLNLHLKDDRA